MLVLTNGKHPIRMIENIRKITAKESRKMSNHIETKCIHGNLDFSWDEPTKAVSFPIYQTATFGHIGLGHSTGFDNSERKIRPDSIWRKPLPPWRALMTRRHFLPAWRR